MENPRKPHKRRASGLSFGEQLSMMKVPHPSRTHSEAEESNSGELERKSDHSRRQAVQVKAAGHSNARASAKADQAAKDGGMMGRRGADNSDAPEERSSKYAAPTRRPKKLARPQQPIWDPRFNPAVAKTAPLSGTYDFLDAYRDRDMDALRAAAKAAHDPHVKAELKLELHRMLAHKSRRDQRIRDEQVLRDARRKEAEAVQLGKMPYFVNRARRNKMLADDRLKRMTDRQIEKSDARKAKRLAAKEMRALPRERRTTTTTPTTHG